MKGKLDNQVLTRFVSAADGHEEKLNPEPELGAHGDIDEWLPEAVEHAQPEQSEVKYVEACMPSLGLLIDLEAYPRQPRQPEEHNDDE